MADKYINAESGRLSSSVGGIEAISLLPEKYEQEEEFKQNYLTFSFYEHKEEVKRYIDSRRRKSTGFQEKYLCEIKLPLMSDYLSTYINQHINNAVSELDFVPNLLYDSIQQYDGDVDSLTNTMKEGAQWAKEVGSLAGEIDILGAASKSWEFLAGGWGDTIKSMLKDGRIPNPLIDHLVAEGASREKIDKALHHEMGGIAFAALMTGIIKGGQEKKGKPEGTVMSGIKYSTGVAYNPHRRYLYQLENITARAFNFNFVFIPKNEEEVRNIRRAEYLFQKYSTPEKWTGEGYFGEHVNVKYMNHFKWPKKVKIKIFVNGKEFKKFQYLPSVITEVNVNVDQVANKSDRTFIENKKGTIFPSKIYFRIVTEETKIFTRNDMDQVTNLN